MRVDRGHTVNHPGHSSGRNSCPAGDLVEIHIARNNRSTSENPTIRNVSYQTGIAEEGTGLASLLTARGAAFGDLFNDGKIDVVINQFHYVPALLRNVHSDNNLGSDSN